MTLLSMFRTEEGAEGIAEERGAHTASCHGMDQVGVARYEYMKIMRLICISAWCFDLWGRRKK